MVKSLKNLGKLTEKSWKNVEKFSENIEKITEK